MQRIEAEHAQKSRERAKVRVGDEAQIGVRAGFPAVHVHLVAFAHDALYRRGYPIDGKPADFGVRDPERLDGVLESRRAGTVVLEGPASQAPAEEGGERRIE